MALPALHFNQKHPADLWSAVGNALQSQASAPPVVPVPRTSAMPLSPAQERLYFLAQSGQDASSYQVYLAWRVSGPIDAEILERSLGAIVQRHEILRTTFSAAAGRPVGRIAQDTMLRLQVVNLESLAVDRREAEARSLAREEVRRPFDLEQGPLLRAVLFSLSATAHLLVVTISQLAFDGWSMRVFSRELGALYPAFAAAKPSPLPGLPVQWADFVHWQRNLLEGPSLDHERTYWRQQLAQPYAGLRLPVDHARNMAAPRATQEPWNLDAGLTQRLNALAQEEGASHFAALLAAMDAWLHRLTGQEDLMVFASTFARGRVETRGLIGLFANVLPIRTNLAGNPTFREIVRRVRDESMEALAHQSLPFESIMQTLPRAANADAAPLFQVMLIHQNSPLPELRCGDTILVPVHDIDTGHSKFELLWDVSETKGGLQGSFVYRSDLFETATIRALLADFATLLGSLLEAPDHPVSRFQHNGKAGLSSISRQQAEVQSALVAPTSELEAWLAALWETLFQRSRVGIRDNFFDLGGDSLLAVRMFSEIGPLTGRRLPLSVLFAAPTIEKLAKLISQNARAGSACVVPIQPRGSRAPMFCISGVGGAVLLFHRLARHMHPDQPMYGLEPPELDGEQALLANMQDIASRYIQEMRAVQPQGPYHIVGFSFGGMVAFEIAQQLASQGERVGLLAMFDTASSSGTSRGLAAYRAHLKAVLFGPQRLKYLHELVRGKAFKIFLQFFRFAGCPLPASVTATGRVVDVQTFAQRHYKPQVYPGRVTLFRARNRPQGENVDYDLGWGSLASGGVEVQEVPGDHHTMVVDPNIRVVAASLEASLEKARTQITEGAPV